MEHKIYLISAIAGCGLVLLQVILQVFGLFGDMDVDHDGDVHMDADGHGDAFFGVLSFKALCAFAGIFGLVGLIMLDTAAAIHVRLFVAFGGGSAAMVMVAWMMRMLHRLQSSGTIDVQNAMGRTGTVYLRIPASNDGRGKVTVEVQGRSMQFEAYTEGEQIDTGARVTVVAVESNDTLKVTRI